MADHSGLFPNKRLGFVGFLDVSRILGFGGGFAWFETGVGGWYQGGIYGDQRLGDRGWP
jgi:hypothetical protein